MKNANPVSRYGVPLLVFTLALTGCRNPAGQATGSVPALPALTGPEASEIARYSYTVVKAWPHDPAAFTQGLAFHEGNLIESTGLHGQSSLREVDVKTGRVLKQVDLARAYFAEGVAVIGSRVFQLTWQNRKGFVYDVDTFQLQEEFTYEGEGWGLTTDGTALILSDGTNRIRFLDPADFSVTRTLEVTRSGRPVDQLNELEFIHGEILANVWQTFDVVRIDPATGNVRGVIDFSGLLAPPDRRADTDVFNGIAYDAENDRLFVTGKRWPRLFEVRLRPQPQAATMQ